MRLIIVLLISTFGFEAIHSQVCFSSPTCGDGILQVDHGEECDDGNVSGGGCTGCKVQCGFSCRNHWGPICNTSSLDYQNFSLYSSSCKPVAGDGKRVADEECDDGNLLSGDGCLCNLTGKVCSGSCSVEERWTCSRVVELASACSSKLPLADKCTCSGSPVDVPTCKGNISSVDGYTGSSSTIQCKACSRNHYGNCLGSKTFCLWNETCSSQGFCSGDGTCICFGNFSGPNCNRCKRDHYGPSCSTYCNALKTCGGHGTCDVNGSCMWNAFCEGALSAPDSVGNGRRLGSEECDDGNLLNGDGCDSHGKVEVGFICLGGCQPNGDVRRRFGECQADVCSPVPCEWALMDSPLGEGSALFVVTPHLSVKMWQSNPFPGKLNSLTVSLAPNIPLPPCVSVTSIVTIQITPVLQQEKSLTTCQTVTMTISSLIGAQLPSSNTLISLSNMSANFFTRNAGRWNDANKSLILTVQQGIKKGETVRFSFQIVNANRGQPSPDIAVSMDGINLPPMLVDKDRTSVPPTPNTVPGDAEPLKIRSNLIVRSIGEREMAERSVPSWDAGRRLLSTSSPVFLNGTVTQSSPDLGAANFITISLLVRETVAAGTRVTVAGLLPSEGLLLFARTSSTQCAQSLPTGPESVGDKSAYLSTSFKNIGHSGFLQRLYDNNSLVFEIFWSFPSVKSLQERFQNARSQGESVVWFIRSPKGVDLIKTGTWIFSRRMALTGDPFDVGSSPGFSSDDGAWGAATGLVDGSIEPSQSNPAISCIPGQDTCNADFWGQGNFNQQDDVGCATKACCDVYFTGTGVSNSTRSEFIRNELFLLPCTRCACISVSNCTLSTSSGNASDAIGQDSCTLNQSQGWIQSFDRSLVHSLDSPITSSAYSFSFVLRNPLAPRPPATVSLSAGNAQAWINLTSPRSIATNSPTVVQGGIGQSAAFPGARNTIFITLAVNFPLYRRTTITINGLLSKSTKFLFWDSAACSGSFVSGTESTVHSFFRQELYDGNMLQFVVIWAFSSSKSLYSRLRTAADIGEPVQFRILQNGTEYLRSGVWKLSNATNLISPFVWGAANGAYTGDPAASGLWGQDSRRGCAQYYVNGVKVQSTAIRHEIFMLETAFLYPISSGSSDVQGTSNGDLVVTLLTSIEPSTVQVFQFMLQNQVAARAPSNVSVSIAGCSSINDFKLVSDLSLIPNATGALAGDSQPLLVRNPAFLTAVMGQSTPYPTALNNISVTLAVNILLDPNAKSWIRFTNLLGASAESGELRLTSPDGKSHLHFASSTGARPGYGFWNDTVKSLQLYVCTSVEVATQLVLSFVVENPPYSQSAPTVTAMAQSGDVFSTVVLKDLGSAKTVSIPGSASALFVLCPFWLSAKVGQSTSFPSDLNTITILWSTNFPIRPASRAYGQFVLLITGLKNAAAPLGLIPISAACRSCFAASWDDSFKALSIQVLASLDPNVEYALSFNVTNPPRGQSPQSIALSSTSIMVASDSSCNGFLARDFAVLPYSTPPMAVITAQFTQKRVGQSNPYPGAINVITVTISTNVPLFVSSRTIVGSTAINISGLQGALFNYSGRENASIAQYPDTAANSLRPFYATWNNGSESRSPGIGLIVVRQTDSGANYTLSFTVTNQLQGQSSPPIFINCVGIYIDTVAMDPDNASAPVGLPGTVVGDAAPLKIYSPLFSLKNIGQSTPYPAVVNTISITLSFNVDLRQSCLLYTGWRVVISNLTGGPSTYGDIALEGPGTSVTRFASAPSGGVGYGQWSGNSVSGGKMTIYLVGDIAAGVEYFFNFKLNNPTSGQMSPPVAIQALYGDAKVLIGKSSMDRDNTTVLPVLLGRAGDALPLQIRTAAWITKIMGQSTPFPGALNTLTVTLLANVPIFSSLSTAGSIGTPCSTSFEEMQMPQCQRDLLLQSCLRTVVTISGLSGAIFQNCSATCPMPVSWGPSDALAPCQWVWNANSNSLTFTVANYVKENTTLLFSFNVTNPVAGQASPPISVQVSGVSFSRVAIEKDLDDRAPLLVYSIQFRIKQISQSNPYPFAQNCITIVLQTNLKLTLETVFQIYSFLGMSPVGPDNSSSIQILDPQCSCLMATTSPTCTVPYFASSSCVNTNCNGLASRAVWNGGRSGLVLYMAREVEAGENISFTFLLQNAGTAPPPMSIYIESQVGTVLFPSVPMDGILTFISAQFQVKNIGQANPYPAAQNYITVTMAMNVPMFAKAANQFTILGLRGVSMPNGIIQLLGLSDSACWLPCNQLQVDCGSIAPPSDNTPGYAYWTSDVQGISFRILKDIPKNESVVFRFAVVNPSRAQQSPTVSVAVITGSVPIPYASMISDQGMPIRAVLCGGTQSAGDHCQSPPQIGDASVLKVRTGEFVFTELCMIQTSRFLGSVNTITATISTSVPISAKSKASFYLSGLSGATLISEDNSSQYQVLDCSDASMNLTWGSLTWRDTSKTVFFDILVDTVPFWKYVVSFNVVNPSRPQESPIITLGLQGIQMAAVRPCKDRYNPPLLVEEPSLSATVCQSTALPGAVNDITVNLTTNVPISPSLQAKIVISGFSGLSLWCDTKVCPSLKGRDNYIFGDASGLAGHGDWNPNDLSLTVSFVNNTLNSVQYDLIFTLLNPLLAQNGEPVSVDFSLGGVEYSTFISSCSGIYKPGYIVENRVVEAGIYGSTNYPGAINHVTFLLQMELALDTSVTVTFTGLTGSATGDTTNLAVYCPMCCSEYVLSCPCPMNNRPCETPISRQNCAQEQFNGTAQWNQVGGRLQLTPVTSLLGSVSYYFTVDLQNPMSNQENPPVTVKFSLSNIAAKQLRQVYPSFPFPANVDRVRFLILAAGQSSPYPCDLNTVSITLAVNVPLSPGTLVLISGYSSAKFSCDRRSGAACLSSISSTQGVFAPYAAWQASRPGMLNLTISNANFLPAGCNFTANLTFRNPSYGQDSPLGQYAEVHNITVTPFSQFFNIPKSAVDVGVGNSMPLKVLTAAFDVKSLSFSNPNVGAVNVITLTFATNVKFRLDCYVSITLSGLPPTAANLMQVAYPGPDALDPFQWRSDSCPVSARTFFTVFNPSTPSACALRIAATPQGVGSWLAFVPIQNASSCLFTDCLGTKYGRSCGYGLAWETDETLLNWMRGQRSYLSNSSYQHARDTLAALGDGSCDPRWTCANWAYNDGQCAPGRAQPSDTTGSVFWNASSRAVSLFLRNETCPSTNYTVEFQITNPKSFQVGAYTLSAHGRDGLAIPETPVVGPTGTSFAVAAASFVIKSIGQSVPYPGASNIITLTIATNAPVTERMLYWVTVVGLKGAVQASGDLPLMDASASGGNDHLNFRASPISPRGFARWDNTLKRLMFLVASDLLPLRSYAVKFQVFNGASGQVSPVILIGSSSIKCSPNSRPASANVPLVVNDVRGYELESCSYTLKSLDDQTARPGGVWTPSSALLPPGKWVVTFSKAGYVTESMEVDIRLTLDQVIIASTASEGTACDGTSVRAAFQKCYWESRAQGLETFLVPIVPNVAWFVLTWDDASVDLQVWLVAKDATGSSPWIGANCSGGNLIQGGGVYPDCPDAVVLGTGSRLRVHTEISRSFDQVVVSLFKVPAGEYHVYVTVDSPTQRFSGTERGRAYMPDGTSVSAYTSLLRSQDGFWWYVGYFIKQLGGDGISFRVLNYDQLTSDPIPYKSGYILTLQIQVIDPSSGLYIPNSNYMLRRMQDGLAVSKGIVTSEVPGTIILQVLNQNYSLEVSSAGYVSKNVTILSTPSLLVQIYLLPNPQTGIIRLLLSGILSPDSTSMYLIPCSNTGAWVSISGKCPGATEGSIPIVYSGCLQLQQGRGLVSLDQPQCADKVFSGACSQWTSTSSNFESVSLKNVSAGDYDLHVNLGNVPYMSRLELSISLPSPNSTAIIMSSPAAPLDGGSWWWHVGFLRVGSGATQFFRVDALSSDPTYDGCRVASNFVVTKFDSSKLTTVSVNVGSGRFVILDIPAGVWPKAVAQQVTVSALTDPPRALPVNATAVSVVVFFDPSGILFPTPGVNITLPITIALPQSRLLYPNNPLGLVVAVHRLSRGVWMRLPSTLLTDASDNVIGVVATTLSFSAYTLLVLPGEAPTGAQLNSTVLGNTTKIEPSSTSFPMGAVIGGAVGGVVVVLLAFFLIYRLYYRSSKSESGQRKKVEYSVPAEHLPYKSPVAFTNIQIATEQNSRIRNSVTKFAFGADEEEPVNSNLHQLAGNGDSGNEDLHLESQQSVNSYMKQRPLDALQAPTVAPFAITELVRRGQLLPSRSSMVEPPEAQGQQATAHLIMYSEKEEPKQDLKK